MDKRQEEFTRLLQEKGDPQTPSRLLPLMYEELRELAQARLASERPDQTLQATALVHEAYLRLLGGGQKDWNSRGHFFGAAAEAMRRILVERARHRGSQKRGGGWQRITLSGLEHTPAEELQDRIQHLDQVITLLEKQSDVRAHIVKLRFFAGLSIEQTAEVLGVSPATVRRHWTIARAWLAYELRSVNNRPMGE